LLQDDDGKTGFKNKKKDDDGDEFGKNKTKLKAKGFRSTLEAEQNGKKGVGLSEGGTSTKYLGSNMDVVSEEPKSKQMTSHC
jgi:hypothetical protein